MAARPPRPTNEHDGAPSLWLFWGKNLLVRLAQSPSETGAVSRLLYWANSNTHIYP